MLKSKTKSLTSMISEVIDSNGNENKRTKKVCQKKSAKIEAAVDLIDRISDAEEFYFQSIRDEFPNKAMNVVKNFGFDVCRACLSPELRLIKLDNENLTFFQTIIKLTYSFNWTNSETTAMCETCLKKLIAAHDFITGVEELENNSDEVRLDDDLIYDRTLTMFSDYQCDNQGEDGSSTVYNQKKQNETEEKSLNAKKTNIRDKSNDQMMIRNGYKCNVCDKILVSKCSLKNHLNSVHEKLKRFTCGSCSKMFYSNDKLNQHIENNHNKIKAVFDISRPFQCNKEKCEKFFKTKKELNQHSKTHSDDRLFVCSCLKAFKRSSHLKRHQRTHDADKKDLGNNNSNSSKPSRRSDKNQQLINGFDCFICGKVIGTKYYLRCHIESVHSKIKNFSCDLCQKKFHLKTNLRVHIVSVHINKGKRLFQCDFEGCKCSYSSKYSLHQHRKLHDGD